MTTVGPSLSPQTPVAAPRTDAAALAAARAFFDAALGRTPAPAASAPAAVAVISAGTTPAVLGSEAPTKIPRPGSLIDIRV